MRFFGLALLILSGASIFSALSDTPAFDPDARKETVLGGWRIAANTAMYDRGTYAFQRGYGFLAADALFTANTENRDELASADIAEVRALQAIEALKEAVSVDPGNAYAWASLGWGMARIADDQAALEALRTSWKLAPNNRVLADSRIALIGAITMPDISTVELSAADQVSVQQDIANLRLHDENGLQFNIEAHPHLKNIPAS